MQPETPDESLSEREQVLLKVLVGSYIRDGQPVGSRALSRESGLALSSATIRNIVADLEQLGFVSSPHTSAGRIPTDKGYRFFVDSLLKARSPIEDDPVFTELRRQLDSAPDDPKALVAAASQLLSNVTRLAGVVTLPRAQQASITQIEFVGLSDNRALVILVFNDREVQNRIIHLERYHSSDELRRAATFLTERCRGKTLQQVRAEILKEMQDARETMNALMKDAIQVAERVFTPDEPNRMDYVLAGETNLMGAGELSSVDKLRRLFEAFNEKRDILNLLDHSLRADGVQIFIGQESGYRILDDVSMVTAPYSADNEVVGVIGVIGPTRMAYERVIPIVDVTAKILGAALARR
ncbi:MAG TPA: heat-inducible transcriptional repressor HrcA [Steroidobacteraceae bacterium]|nr:heat-inducible transcriptional repressor HrcA [Steroidobacteraceae bacterium]